MGHKEVPVTHLWRNSSVVITLKIPRALTSALSNILLNTDPATAQSDAATGGGSHDPSRVEPLAAAMKKSIPGKSPKEVVSIRTGSGGQKGFREVLEGRF